MDWSTVATLTGLALDIVGAMLLTREVQKAQTVEAVFATAASARAKLTRLEKDPEKFWEEQIGDTSFAKLLPTWRASGDTLAQIQAGRQELRAYVESVYRTQASLQGFEGEISTDLLRVRKRLLWLGAFCLIAGFVSQGVGVMIGK